MPGSMYFVLLYGGATIIGAALLCMGLRVLALRRPFVIRGFWLSGSILVGVVAIAGPGVSNGAARLLEGDLEYAVMFGWCVLMICMALLAVARFNGLVGFGVTSRSVRDALFAALRDLRIDGTESLTAVELNEYKSRIEVTADGWMGMTQLRASDPAGRRLLPAIAQGMNRYFRSTRVPLALVSPATYAAFGGILLGLVTYFLIAY